MARGFLKLYRTYSYLTKSPVVDVIRTVLQDEGMYSKKQRKTLSELSGVGQSTYEGWFEGETRNPRHETIMATMTALGYEEKFVKAKTINVEAELKAAATWRDKQEKLKEKTSPPKPNGGRKPKKRG
jgi:transcriptional regulator with XRE-family HTH domain